MSLDAAQKELQAGKLAAEPVVGFAELMTLERVKALDAEYEQAEDFELNS